MSHPTWVRGLKLTIFEACVTRNKVAPYVGAWIETVTGTKRATVWRVAPYVGAWIETCYLHISATSKAVAPYVGAWIETEEMVDSTGILGRTLRGCVD